MKESDLIFVRAGWRTYRKLAVESTVKLGDLVTTREHRHGTIVIIRDNPPGGSFVSVHWDDDLTVTEHRL